MLSGCASILSSSTYPVSIQSNESNTNFTITNSSGAVIHSGSTPTTLSLEAGAGFFKKEVYTITYSKDGYDTQPTTLQPEIDGWYIGNILFGGIIGLLVVDPASGAMWKLPPSVSGHLNSKESAQSGEGTVLKIVNISMLTDSQKLRLEKIE